MDPRLGRVARSFLWGKERGGKGRVASSLAITKRGAHFFVLLLVSLLTLSSSSLPHTPSPLLPSCHLIRTFLHTSHHRFFPSEHRNYRSTPIDMAPSSVASDEPDNDVRMPWPCQMWNRTEVVKTRTGQD